MDAAPPHAQLIAIEVGDAYLRLMAHGGAVPPDLSKQDKVRTNNIITLFGAVATTEEKTLLKPAAAGGAVPDEGERRRVAVRLQRLVVARLADGYEAAGCALPSSLRKGRLSASALEEHVRRLRRANPPVMILPQDVASWLEARKTAFRQVCTRARARGAANSSLRRSLSAARTRVRRVVYFTLPCCSAFHAYAGRRTISFARSRWRLPTARSRLAPSHC